MKNWSCAGNMMSTSSAIGNRRTSKHKGHGRQASSPPFLLRWYRHRQTCTPRLLGAVRTAQQKPKIREKDRSETVSGKLWLSARQLQPPFRLDPIFRILCILFLVLNLQTFSAEQDISSRDRANKASTVGEKPEHWKQLLMMRFSGAVEPPQSGCLLGRLTP